MATLDKLTSGSYRGVQGFYRSTSELGGFKHVEHLFPGSDNFTLEQLGRMPKRIDTDWTIKFDDRERWENALNTPGTGILSHPTLGNLSVKVKEYTRVDTLEDLGVYNYTVQFVVELGLALPTIEGIATSIINTLRSKLVTSATSFIKLEIDDVLKTGSRVFKL